MSWPILLVTLTTNSPRPNTKIQLNIIPQEIVKKYNLEDVVESNGWVYIHICKGMYGLKQELQKHLKQYGYHPITFTPGLWKHKDKDTVFSLVVEDFAIKYTSEENSNHLIQALKDTYEVSIDSLLSASSGIVQKKRRPLHARLRRRRLSKIPTHPTRQV